MEESSSSASRLSSVYIDYVLMTIQSLVFSLMRDSLSLVEMMEESNCGTSKLVLSLEKSASLVNRFGRSLTEMTNGELERILEQNHSLTNKEEVTLRMLTPLDLLLDLPQCHSLQARGQNLNGCHHL